VRSECWGECLVLRGMKKEEAETVTWRWLHNLYFSPDIMKLPNWRQMRRAESLERMGEIKMYTKCWSWNLKGKYGFWGAGGKTTLKRFLKK
jgi:hypothetical protein